MADITGENNSVLWYGNHRCASRFKGPALKDFRQLRRESAFWFLIALLAAATIVPDSLFRSASRSGRGRSARLDGQRSTLGRLRRRILSSSGARSKRRMIDCISSAVGASTNAKPFDSCVSWFRMTLTESATRSSAASHCLMSSAATQIGKLPKKTVKLIQFAALTPWIKIGGW
jgi:hypothetical protein